MHNRKLDCTRHSLFSLVFCIENPWWEIKCTGLTGREFPKQKSKSGRWKKKGKPKSKEIRTWIFPITEKIDIRLFRILLDSFYQRKKLMNINEIRATFTLKIFMRHFKGLTETLERERVNYHASIITISPSSSSWSPSLWITNIVISNICGGSILYIYIIFYVT